MPRPLVAIGITTLAAAAPASAGFRAEEIARDLNVVYAVAIADVNKDRKPDVVAINNTQAFWLQNPTWKKHVVFDGPASKHEFWKKDNVCFAMEDIDGDGHLDMALGADWQPTNTESGGSVQWLRNSRSPTTPWTLHPIGTEPTVHRMRWADVNGDGKRELVVKALHGRGTKRPDWEGQGLRVMVFHRPRAPATDPWLVEIADESLHIGHNFLVDGNDLVIAAKEGLHRLHRDGRGQWVRTKIGDGAPGEVKAGKVGGVRYLATIEPWHGTKVVVYREPQGAGALWSREDIDAALTGGHGIGWGDFDGDGDDELVAGWRDGKVGVAQWKRGADGAWHKSMIDEGGMATEDIAVGDLDGDGRPEIVAGGRATSNIKIYWPDKPAKGAKATAKRK